MSVEVQQIAVLTVFGLVMMFANIKAGSTWLKFMTLLVMIMSLGAAAWLIVGWVFLNGGR